MNTLDVKPYDPVKDSIEIEGTRYSGTLFREFACSFPNMIGQILRVDKKDNGLVTVTRLEESQIKKLDDQQCPILENCLGITCANRINCKHLKQTKV